MGRTRSERRTTVRVSERERKYSTRQASLALWRGQPLLPAAPADPAVSFSGGVFPVCSWVVVECVAPTDCRAGPMSCMHAGGAHGGGYAGGGGGRRVQDPHRPGQTRPSAPLAAPTSATPNNQFWQPTWAPAAPSPCHPGAWVGPACAARANGWGLPRPRAAMHARAAHAADRARRRLLCMQSTPANNPQPPAAALFSLPPPPILTRPRDRNLVPPAPPTTTEPLPAGWTKAVTDDGTPYYLKSVRTLPIRPLVHTTTHPQYALHLHPAAMPRARRSGQTRDWRRRWPRFRCTTRSSLRLTAPPPSCATSRSFAEVCFGCCLVQESAHASGFIASVACCRIG